MEALIFMFTVASYQHQLPTGLLESICYVESTHNPSAVHLNDGVGHSLGICQIKVKTARMVGFKGTEAELMKPDINIEFAAKYLRHQIKRYHGNVSKAVIAYNQGSAGQLLTTKYSQKVFAYSKKINSNIKTERLCLK